MSGKLTWIAVLVAVLAIIFLGCNPSPEEKRVEVIRCEGCARAVADCVCTPPENALFFGEFNWDPESRYGMGPNQQGWTSSANVSTTDILNAKTFVLKLNDSLGYDIKIVFQSGSPDFWGEIELEYDHIEKIFKRPSSTNYGYNGVTINKNRTIFSFEIAQVLGNNHAAFYGSSGAYANIILMYYGAGSDSGDSIEDLEIITAFIIPGPCPDCGEVDCRCDECDTCKKDPCNCHPDNALILGEFTWTYDPTEEQQGWQFDEEGTAILKTAEKFVIRFKKPISAWTSLMFTGDGISSYFQVRIIETPEGVPTVIVDGVTLSENKKYISVDIKTIFGSDYDQLLACTTNSSLVFQYMGGHGIGSLGEFFAFLERGDNMPVTDKDINLTAPEVGAIPVTSITTNEYTASIKWEPPITDVTFASETVYTATITLSAGSQYYFEEDIKFTVNSDTTAKTTFIDGAPVVEFEFPRTGIARDFEDTLDVIGEPFTYQELIADYSGEGEDIIIYQWFRNNNIIPGATGETYTPILSGNYKVRISAAGFNPKDSNDITVNATTTAVVKATVDDVVQNVTVTAIDSTIAAIGDGAGYWYTREKDNEQSYAHFEITFPGGLYLSDFNRVSLSYEGVSGDLSDKTIGLLGDSFTGTGTVNSSLINLSSGTNPLNIGPSVGAGSQSVIFSIDPAKAAAYDNESTVQFIFYIHQEATGSIGGNNSPTSYKINNITFVKKLPDGTCTDDICLCTPGTGVVRNPVLGSNEGEGAAQGTWNGTVTGNTANWYGGAIRYTFPANAGGFDITDYDFVTIKYESTTTSGFNLVWKQYNTGIDYGFVNNLYPNLSAIGEFRFQIRGAGGTGGVALQRYANTTPSSSVNFKIVEVIFEQGTRYTVSFNLGGYESTPNTGTPPAAIKVVEGTVVGSLPNPTWAGYVFEGWTFNGAPITANTDVTSALFAGGITLTATWRTASTAPTEPMVFDFSTITVTANNGIISNQNASSYTFTNNGGGGYDHAFAKFTITLPQGRFLGDYSTLTLTYQGISGDYNFKDIHFLAAPTLPNPMTPAVHAAAPPAASQDAASPVTRTLTLNSYADGLSGTIEICFLIRAEPTGGGNPTSWRISNVQLNP